MGMKFLCIRCENDLHTNASTATAICGCTLRTCACYDLRIKAGVEKDKEK